MDYHAVLQPTDGHNRELEAAVHPPEWKNPAPSGRYHLVVIGAGTAGLVTAAGAAGLGARVALIERALMGGDCLNVGCVPSKAVLSAARVAATVRGAEPFGVRLPGGCDFDFAKVMERMRRIRAQISPADSAARFHNLGVDVYFGDAQFTDPRHVDVGGTKLAFKRAVIATGSRPAPPPIPGLDQVPYLTNETIFSLTERPRRLGVVGAGPIGCELAQAFARLGSEVVLIQSTHGVLPRDDSEAAKVVEAALVRDGVQLLCCGKQLRVEQTTAGVRLTGTSHEAPYDVEVDRLLVATGRAPNVDGLSLDRAQVAYDVDAGVHVDDRLRTTNPRVYAAGDVCSKFQFTHAADYMARTVIQNALFMGRKKMSQLVIPWCTYTDPELAQVGLTQNQADRQGIAIHTFRQPWDEVDRAILDGQEQGLVKIHVAQRSRRIVGATVVGSQAGELIGELTLAMTHGITPGKLADTIHPYPTRGEAVRKLGDQFNRSRLTPTVRWILRKWLRWTR